MTKKNNFKNQLFSINHFFTISSNPLRTMFGTASVFFGNLSKNTEHGPNMVRRRSEAGPKKLLLCLVVKLDKN